MHHLCISIVAATFDGDVAAVAGTKFLILLSFLFALVCNLLVILLRCAAVACAARTVGAGAAVDGAGVLLLLFLLGLTHNLLFVIEAAAVDVFDVAAVVGAETVLLLLV
jgi:hypothetical protein